MARSPSSLLKNRTTEHRTPQTGTPQTSTPQARTPKDRTTEDRTPQTRTLNDQGGIVLGWLTRIVLFFAVAGLALFDAISIGTTAMTVADQGSFAALQASEDWQTSKSLQSAYNAAVAVAASENPTDVIHTDDFKVDDDGTVHLTVSRNATTLIIFRIGAIKDWAHIERHATGKAVDG